MPLDQYFKTLQKTTNQNPISLEDFKSNKYIEGDMQITECIADPNAKSPLMVLEEKDTKKNMAELIDGLPESEKMVLSLYYYKEFTMREIGMVMKVTESRVCQIHGRALNVLKARLNRSCSLEASSDGLKNEKSIEYSCA
jgi:RNA polymerase sigma factor for flagellar operon FliA